MAKYHVNPVSGNGGLCKAESGRCPFGGDEAHFTSMDAARASFEANMASFASPSPLKKLSFGGGTYKNVTFEGARYSSNGEIAILAYADGDYGPEPLTDVTINLEELRLKPEEGAFFIKDYSENEGLAKALADAGVVELTGRDVTVNPWGSKALEARLKPKYRYLAADSNWPKVTEE